MSFCSSSSVCLETAPSSAKRKSRKYCSLILVLAFNLARLKGLPLDLVWRLILSVEGPKVCFYTEEFRGAASFRGNLEEPISAYQVKSLVEVTKWDVQWISMFSIFFLVVIWWRVSYQLWIVWHGKQNVTLESLFASTWRSLKGTRAKSFPAMLRSEMPR